MRTSFQLTLPETLVLFSIHLKTTKIVHTARPPSTIPPFSVPPKEDTCGYLPSNRSASRCCSWSSLRRGLLAVGGDKAMYVGGTAALPEKAEGPLSTTATDRVTFTPKDKKAKALVIPYTSITGMEYGQKA